MNKKLTKELIDFNLLGPGERGAMAGKKLRKLLLSPTKKAKDTLKKLGIKI